MIFTALVHIFVPYSFSEYPPKMSIIEILWQGPFTLDDVLNREGEGRYGIYQIYGTHPIYGTDALLYIGQANELTFAERLNGHKGWLQEVPSEPSIYLGRLGGMARVSEKEWAAQIHLAERLLIATCLPAFNASNLNGLGKPFEDAPASVRVLNFGKYHRLLPEVSTDWYSHPLWLKQSGWKHFA
jgi:hypothetical protein